MSQPGAHLSKEFFELIKSIGESRSKQDEDKIVLSEVSTLKVKMAEKNVPAKRMKEYLLRMLYVEMLGHDGSFGHIHGVKMAHSKNILEKRVGYLAVSLTLNPEHQFMLLLINTIQNDLKSDNFLEVIMGLTVCTKLVSAETIPALLPLVTKLLDHKEGIVRKKAVMAVHRFLTLDASSVSGLTIAIRKALCDTNISVMAASLNVLYDLAVAKPQAYKDLVPDFVSILRQVIEHRLPREYDYHRMPAPWVQLKLLQILGVLGASDKQASEGMYEILHEVMKRSDAGINISYAILYECVHTITMIYPDQALIEDAALSVSRFITSENHNLKYLGINALALIVQIDAKYAAEHQLVVIDCLEDPDETLRRKTLDLLYSMTNPANVTVVVEKLMGYLKNATDQYMRTDLISRIAQISEKYAPSNSWYIGTLNTLIEMAGDLAQPELAQNIMRLITDNAAGAAGDEDLREFSVDTYMALLQSRRTLPDLLLQVVAWVIGEYGHTSQQYDPNMLLLALEDAMSRTLPDQSVTKGFIISAMLKLVALLPSPPQPIIELVARYQNSLFLDLQQRAHEFQELVKLPQILSVVLPRDGASEQIDVDETLAFLNGYVDAALHSGAKPYQNKSAFGRKDAHAGALKYGPYNPPPSQQQAAAAAALNAHQQYGAPGGHASSSFNPYQHQDPNAPSFFGAPGGASAGPAAPTNGGFGSFGPESGAKRVWGPSGYNDPNKSAQQQQQQHHAPSSGGSFGPHSGASQSSNAGLFAQPAPAAAPSQPEYLNNTSATGSFGPQSGAGGSFGPQSGAGGSFGPQSGSFGPPGAQARREPPPRVVSEKEKLASSLFAAAPAGATGAPAAGIRRPPPRRQDPPAAAPAAAAPAAAAPAPAAPAAAAPKPAAPATLDLFGSAIAAPAPAAKPAAAGGGLMDLFGAPAPAAAAPAAATKPAAPAGGGLMDLFGAPTPTPAAAAPKPAAPAGGGGLMDLFGAPAPAPAAAQAASSAPSLMDGFGFGAAAPSGESLGAANATANIKKLLESTPKAQAQEHQLAQDARLHISAHKLLSNDNTVVALFFTNRSAQPIQSVQITAQTPMHLHVTVSGDPNPPFRPGQVAGQFLIGMQSLPAKTTATVLLSMHVKDASFASAPLAVSAQVAYGGAQAPLTWSLPLQLSDLLRPAVMNTQQYGANWKTYTEEAKASIRPSSCGTPADFMERMTNRVRIHPVQTIGQENIVAGRLVSPPQAANAANLFVFVHGKVVPGAGVDVICRSKAGAVSQALAKLLTAALE